MAEARAAHAPYVAPDDAPQRHDVPPAVSRDGPGPRAAQWRAQPRRQRRPLARCVGIGSCLMLVGLVMAAMLTQPVGAEFERLIRPWLEWTRDQAVAALQADWVLPTAPEPVAARNDPPPRAIPTDAAPKHDLEMLARESAVKPGQPATVLPEGAALSPADEDQRVRTGPPVPSLKPAAQP